MGFQQILVIWLVLTIAAAILGPLSNLVGTRPDKASGASEHHH
jgi:hypothetical protein